METLETPGTGHFEPGRIRIVLLRIRWESRSDRETGRPIAVRSAVGRDPSRLGYGPRTPGTGPELTSWRKGDRFSGSELLLDFGERSAVHYSYYASASRPDAGGGTRTRKGVSPEVFETSASTYSATPAQCRHSGDGDRPDLGSQGTHSVMPSSDKFMTSPFPCGGAADMSRDPTLPAR